MLVIAASLLGAFILAAVFTDDVDDDDDFDGGMLIPAHNPV